VIAPPPKVLKLLIVIGGRHHREGRILLGLNLRLELYVLGGLPHRSPPVSCQRLLLSAD
jgi:hypothetical protein